MNYYGSICLSDIPREVIKPAANGKLYVNIRVVERREVGQYGDTHFVSVAPKKEEQVEGVNYIVGNLKESIPVSLRPESIDELPPVSNGTALPWE